MEIGKKSFNEHHIGIQKWHQPRNSDHIYVYIHSTAFLSPIIYPGEYETHIKYIKVTSSLFNNHLITNSMMFCCQRVLSEITYSKHNTISKNYLLIRSCWFKYIFPKGKITGDFFWHFCRQTNVNYLFQNFLHFRRENEIGSYGNNAKEKYYEFKFLQLVKKAWEKGIAIFSEANSSHPLTCYLSIF